MKKQLLLVWHSRTGLAKAMAEAIERGALAAAQEMGESSRFIINRRRAADAVSSDLLAADGYAFCAPENLASTSGAMLEFFHSTYYAAFITETNARGESVERSALAGRPYGLAVAAGSDGTSAARQMARIAQGWRLRPVVEEAVIIQNGQPQTAAAIALPKTCSPEAIAKCEELGGIVAATILL